MKRHLVLFTLVIILMCYPAAHSAANGFFSTASNDTVTVLASGSKQVPSVNTNGTGTLTLIMTGDTLKVKGTFKNLNSYYTGAYIHMGARDENGNALYKLNATGLSEDHKSGKFKVKDNKFYLTDPIKRYYKKDMLYINIITNQSPSGEIRGQIVSPS